MLFYTTYNEVLAATTKLKCSPLPPPPPPPSNEPSVGAFSILHRPYISTSSATIYDRNYLQAIGKEDFTPSSIVEVAAAPRLAIVLPLQIEDGRVVPIPLIIDTGAPGFMYLGTGCRRALAELGVLEEVVGSYPYRLRGAIYRGDTRVFNPPAWNLPPHHESLALLDDVRLNLLGLDSIKAMGGELVL